MRAIALALCLLTSPAVADPCSSLVDAATAANSAAQDIGSQLQSISETASGGMKEEPGARPEFHGIMMDSQRALISIRNLMDEIEASLVSSGCN